MQIPNVDEDVVDFVLALVGVGSTLGELVADLADALPDDAYPGESPVAVVVEMLCGSIATALVSVDTQDVRRARELIELARARTREHLQLMGQLSRRMDAPDEGVGRTYG